MYFMAEHGGRVDVIDDQQNSLLHLASRGNHRDAVKMIIEKTKARDINTRNAFGQKPIHIAAEHGHNRVMKYIITYGADINSR